MKYYIFTAWLYFFLGNLSTMDDLLYIFVGIYFCYNANQKGDNANFIDRMICLGVPLSIRIFSSILLFLIIGIFIGVTYVVISNAGTYDDFFRQLILGYIRKDPEVIQLIPPIKGLFIDFIKLAFFPIYYFMLWSSIKKVSKPVDNNIPAN